MVDVITPEMAARHRARASVGTTTPTVATPGGAPMGDRLAHGHPVFGLLLFELHTVGVGPLLRVAGADFVVFDMEASGLDYGLLSALLPAARASGITSIVRIPNAQPHYATRALDLGADGIMVPMVERAADIAHVVDATLYPPLGQRGAAFGIAHDAYGARSPIDAMAAANERTFVIAQIESASGVANVDTIAAVEHVDALWVGHNDLTNSLGIPGQIDHPDFVKAVSDVRKACKTHGKVLAGVAGSAGAIAPMVADGYRMLSIQSDVKLLQSAFAAALAAAHKA